MNDSSFQIHGAKSHRYEEAPALNEAQLFDLEGTFGVTLPDEFRSFLKSVHSGGPAPGCGMHIDVASIDPELASRPFPYDKHSVAEFLGNGKEGLPFAEADLGGDWPPRLGYIALTHLGCDGYTGIVVAG